MTRRLLTLHGKQAIDGTNLLNKIVATEALISGDMSVSVNDRISLAQSVHLFLAAGT